MISAILSKKNLNPIVTELFIRERKLNISLALITQSYFTVPKNIRLNSADYFVVTIPNKKELQEIAFNRSSDIDFQDFMNLYKKSTVEPYSFLVIVKTVPSDIFLSFRENLLETILVNTAINDKIRDEKLQYDINREAAEISTLLSGKVDKHEHLTGGEELPFDQSRII